MTCFILKLIAVISMTLDHIGVFLVSEEGMETVNSILRCFGRLAFPIYLFLLCEGARHTHSKILYFLKMVLFTFISQPVYNYCFGRDLFYWKSFNIFLTLSVGLLLLFVLIYAEKLNKYLRFPLYCLVLCYCVIFGFIPMIMYDVYGLVLLFALFFYDYRKKWTLLIPLFTNVALNAYYCGRIYTKNQWACLLIYPLLYFYKGKRGKKSGLIFYLYYPFHLFAIGCISRLLTH